MPVPPSPPLDEVITPPDFDHLSDHEAIAAALNNDTASLTADQFLAGETTFAIDSLIDSGTIIRDPRVDGAVGDGVTDDTAALIAAITACANGAATLLINRPYKFSSIGLNLDGVTIAWGAHGSLISSLNKTVDTIAFRITGSDVMLIDPVVTFATAVDIDTDGASRPPNADAVRLGGASDAARESNITVVRGKISYARQAAIRVRFADVVSVTQLRMFESLGNGMMIESISDGDINFNRSNRSGDDGIAVLGQAGKESENVNVIGNIIRKSYAQGINITGCDGGIVGDNNIDETWAPGIHVWQDTGFGMGPSTNIVVRPNIIRRAGTYFGPGQYKTAVGTIPYGLRTGTVGQIDNVIVHDQAVIDSQGAAIFHGGSGVIRAYLAAVPQRTGGGNYVGPTTNTVASTALVDGRLTYTPITIPYNTTITELNVNVVTGAASSVVRLGIYEDGGGGPGSLLLDAGTVDSSTNGLKTITLGTPLVVPAGIYWLAGVAQGGTPTVTTCSGNARGVNQNQNPNSPVNGQITNTVAGALPDPAVNNGVTTAAIAVTVKTV